MHNTNLSKIIDLIIEMFYIFENKIFTIWFISIYISQTKKESNNYLIFKNFAWFDGYVYVYWVSRESAWHVTRKVSIFFIKPLIMNLT